MVMDPIGTIKYAKDTTLAMLLAAQARGCELTYLEQGDLALRDGAPSAACAASRCGRIQRRGISLGEPRIEPLASLDCLLMRKDPPFDMEYIYTTYILERAEAAGVLVLNRPQGLRDMNEKVYTAWFPQCCAPTLVTRDMARNAGFPARARPDRRASRWMAWAAARSSLSHPSDKNTNVIFETLTDYGQRFAIVQRYIPEIVESGDARVLLVDGDRRARTRWRAFRLPRDNRGNLAAGAKGVGRPLTDRERWLAGEIGPALAEQGNALRGPRCHRRLCHRDQRHQPHGGA